MDEYWKVDVTFIKLDEDSDWVLKLSTYDQEHGTRDICQWLGAFMLTDNQLENVTIVWQSLILSRLNVQLGLDMGLLS